MLKVILTGWTNPIILVLLNKWKLEKYNIKLQKKEGI